MSILLIDANSVGNANNATARLTAGDIETQAIFGTLNSIRESIIRYGYTPIALWDGRAQWRFDLYPDYKSKRDPDPNKVLKPYEIKAQQARESYKQQRPHIQRGLKLLGVRQIIPENDEADDIAGYLAKDFSNKGKKVLLISRDHDWLQLVDKNVRWYNPVEKETVTHRTFEQYTGYKDANQFVAEKCLVGDTSDCITGVQGIGEKAAPLILNHYGSVEALLHEVKFAGQGWVAPTKELSRYRKKIIEFGLNTNGGIDIFERNLKLMSLLDVKKPSSLKVIKEGLDEAGFEEFCHELAFHSIIKKFEEWLAPFKA